VKILRGKNWKFLEVFGKLFWGKKSQNFVFQENQSHISRDGFSVFWLEEILIF